MPASPNFLKLVAHDIRWELLKALSFTDLRVQELVQQVGQPQNLVSYHLRLLAENGLVHERRSRADGRSLYYSLDLDRIRQLYRASQGELHPALLVDGEVEQAGALPAAGVFPAAGSHAAPGSVRPPLRVLFLCTHNSARSQMAEGLLRARSRGEIEVLSAGSEPTSIHPLAVRALSEMKIDTGGQRSKSLSDFVGQEFDYIITVCDRAREACPVFPGDPARIHWSIPDPSAVEGSQEERLQAFRETAMELNTRIGYLLIMFQRDRE